MLNAELAQMTSERDALRADLQDHYARVLYVEELVRAKESEKQEIISSYRNVAEAHSKLEASATGLERERTQLAGSVREAEAEIVRLHNHVRAVEAENAGYVVDLQAFERLTSELSASLAQVQAQLAAVDGDRERLIHDRAQGAELMANIEAAKTAVQMTTAQLEAQVGSLTAALQAARSEGAGLEAQLGLERTRARELEDLLAAERVQRLAGQHSEHDLNAAMEAEKQVLLTRIAGLERQLTATHSQMARETASATDASSEAAVLRSAVEAARREAADASLEVAQLRISNEQLAATNRKLEETIDRMAENWRAYNVSLREHLRDNSSVDTSLLSTPG